MLVEENGGEEATLANVSSLTLKTNRVIGFHSHCCDVIVAFKTVNTDRLGCSSGIIFLPLLRPHLTVHLGVSLKTLQTWEVANTRNWWC